MFTCIKVHLPQITNNYLQIINKTFLKTQHKISLRPSHIIYNKMFLYTTQSIWCKFRNTTFRTNQCRWFHNKTNFRLNNRPWIKSTRHRTLFRLLSLCINRPNWVTYKPRNRRLMNTSHPINTNLYSKEELYRKKLPKMVFNLWIYLVTSPLLQIYPQSKGILM